MKILLTGGSACGKSTYAEKIAVYFPRPRYYIATMQPYDDECLAKIARHREMRREKGFLTVERQRDVGGLALPERGTALLECMCNLTANEMFDAEGNRTDVYDKILRDIQLLAAQCENLIVVTNNVGSDVRACDEATQAYVETLGRLNAALAREFDCVYELVCGIPLPWKGELLF